MRIEKLIAREVIDSRGFPTVEAEIFGKNADSETAHGRAIVPSGASTGDAEALELRDGDPKRYLGKGVQKAVRNVKEKIAPAVIGREFSRQALFDDVLLEIDGTPNKAKLGANAILAASMAFARAHASSENQWLYEHLSSFYETKGNVLPVPLMNILNGGAHADNTLEIQEFMIAPVGFKKFSEALRAGAEVFHHLKKILLSKGNQTGVGDEGGFAPSFDNEEPHEQALAAIVQAISDAGYKAGKEIYLALDVASSELIDKNLSNEESMVYSFEGKKLTSQDLVAQYGRWHDSYPIISIEDGLSEHDWKGWAKMTSELGSMCQLVGDDLFVTNAKFLQKGIDRKCANSILVKLNQIGTVTETLETIRLAKQSRMTSVVSHRSGETEDTFIAELAVGTDAGQIKTGSASRTDRIAKYNQLLRIEERLGDQAIYAGTSAFPNL